MFVVRTKQTLTELMSRRLDDVRLAVLMIDGIDLKGRTNIVALGISTDGVKIPLGLWEGSSENKAVASALPADLVDRGLDTEQGVLVVLDGAKALRAAVRKVLGDRTPVQRCIRHKERNVLDHLPEEMRDTVERRLRGAWALTSYQQALGRFQKLAGELEHTHPRRCRVLARRARGDADRDQARDHGQAEADDRINQPVRIDDRVHPPVREERQELVQRGDGNALDRRRDARG
jgi:transposase-like protein